MPVSKIEAELYKEYYICDDCGEGLMIYDPRNMRDAIPSVTGKTTYVHRCSKCDKVHEFEGVYYPREVVESKLPESLSGKPII